jgi:hypothetical protein
MAADFASRKRGEACSGFQGLGFPIGAAKFFSGGGEPLRGFGILTGHFEMAGQLESNHGIAGLLEQIRELPSGVFTRASPTNARGNLLPVRHGVIWRCIVAV